MELASTAPDPASAPAPATAPTTEVASGALGSIADLDRAVAALADQARPFARTPPREKAALLRALVPRLLEIAPEMAAAVCRTRGLDPAGPAAAEAWLAGAVPAITHARLLADSLADIASAGRPALSARDLRKRTDGRLVARLVPRTWAERATHRDREVLVLFTAGTEPEDVIAEQAAFYRQSDPEGGVAVVLAAGTDAAAGLLDALAALFIDGHVVLLALPPSAASLGPLVERAFASLVERGFLRVVLAADEARAHLAAHTGHDGGAPHTPGPAGHDGGAPHTPGPAGHDGGDPHTPGPAGIVSVTGHAGDAPGSVDPIIVVPCLYAGNELASIAHSVASQLAHGAGLDPLAPRVLVLPACWLQRQLFLDHLEKALAAIPTRRTYLPATRFTALTEGRAGAIRVGAAASDALPWTILPDLDPTADDPIFSAASGAGPVIATVSVGCAEPIEMLAAATAFCNERLAGMRSAQLVMHPIHEDEPDVSAAAERAVLELRCSIVGINTWPAVLRWTAAAPWAGSVVGNVRMLPRVDKSVIEGPLRSLRRPAHFHSNGDAGHAGRIVARLAAFAAAPRVRDLWTIAER